MNAMNETSTKNLTDRINEETKKIGEKIKGSGLFDYIQIRKSAWIFACLSSLPGTMYLAHKADIDNLIPNESNIQSGYVVPSEIKIETTDMDKDGRKEVTIKYKGKDYLFMLENGKPTAKEYTLKSATQPEIIYQKN